MFVVGRVVGGDWMRTSDLLTASPRYNESGTVLFGSDDHVLDGIKAFERAGADQILLAGAVGQGTDQLERVAALLGI